MAAPELFRHSTPELYDRFMGPLFFEPYARLMAERATKHHPKRVLETAAGTGILTRALAAQLPGAEIVATDINPAMLEYAAQATTGDRVAFQRADAQQLPMGDGSFDLVLCQFGVMFFPDKAAAAAEAHRVLSTHGRYLLATFDILDRNPLPQAAGEAVASLFSTHPRYMERGPFSYADPDRIRSDLLAGGFAHVEVETIAARTRVNARDAATGIVLGSPFRAEIEKVRPDAIDEAVAAVTKALAPFDNQEAPMSALIVTASR
jgi:ubiquinone/menaquinone biosynthesis C-methylase UbiE